MAHEALDREQHVEGSSDRSFGIVFAVVFLLIGLWPLVGGATPRWWSIGVAGGFAAVALIIPKILAVPNRLWMKLGLLMSSVVSPIALGILFYVIFTPVGALMRLVGKDPLRLKREPAAESYWIRRAPPGPDPKSLTNQF